jgi:predicted nucleic acid-binding protein
MKAAFVDTAFYIALVNPRDSLHASAAELGQRLDGAFVTTEYVLIEVGNWLARTADRPLFLQLPGALQADAATTIVPSSHELFEQGRQLYSRRLDKDWSLTDCTSFVVMRQRGLREALTADRHFEQAGFHVLLT